MPIAAITSSSRISIAKLEPSSRRFEDHKEDTLLNPLVVIEVLSTTTESYDRGEKFGHYRRVPSVTDYVLVAQNRMRVEHFHREPNGAWTLTELSESQEVLILASLQCAVPLAEIYDKVKLQPVGLHPTEGNAGED